MKVINAGILCPYRMTSSGIEVLLTRRSFWNKEKDRPMKFPGEWVFPGGSQDPTDLNLQDTAVRENCEETGYKGPVKDIRFLRTFEEKTNGDVYSAIFFLGRLVEPYRFNMKKEEVIDLLWIDPEKAFWHIYSKEFRDEQLREIEKRGLDDKVYGEYALKKRQVPNQTVHTLLYIHQLNQEMIIK